MSSGASVNIDLAAINAEVDGLSLEDLKEQVLKAKVRQMVATKKYYNPETAKKTRVKRAAMLKVMFEKLKAAGVYDDVMKQAGELADEQLAEQDGTEVAA